MACFVFLSSYLQVRELKKYKNLALSSKCHITDIELSL